MKYKHEFAIKHLPYFVIGCIVTALGGIFLSLFTHSMIFGTLTSGYNLTFIAVGAIASFIGGVSLIDGIEYTKKIAPPPADPPIKKPRDNMSWDERREQAINFDFALSKEEIQRELRAGEKAKAAQKMNELNTNVLED